MASSGDSAEMRPGRPGSWSTDPRMMMPAFLPGDDQASRRASVATTYDRLKKIVVEQLGVDEADVKPEASFVDDLNADSLDLVELIMSLEEEFGTEISDEDAEKIRTVQDAADFIDEHGAALRNRAAADADRPRSEEHTSE